MTTAMMHRHRVQETISALLDTQTVSISDLLDAPRRLATSVASPIDVPGFDNSSMDGYAVAASTLNAAAQRPDHDAQGNAHTVYGPLPVRGRVAAGAIGEKVAPGAVIEIMTGAPLPEGTDTVIAIEATAPAEFGAPEITIALPSTDTGPRPGTFVRTRGSDVTAGTTVLDAGLMLTPAHLGVAASCGITALEVQSLPRVLIVSTGDEITAEAAAGIHDANSITLGASLRRLGVDTSIITVPDDPQALLDAVRGADCDLVISTGGISKGAHEVVKLAADLDGESSMVFEPIAMQPGGPQGCGHLANTAWVALPGNPVSALISFEMFIRPALLGLAVDEEPRETEYHRLLGGLDEAPPSGKLQVRRAVMDAEGLKLVGGARSHLLHNYALSTHLVFIPPTDSGARSAASGAQANESEHGADDRLKTWKIT
ncbi:MULTISPECIES: molybdopterin molybdotransferase MoeA [unclassified Brevibacterium]|uniref:molybdopterin molybdotransferase MoeA n=1 Tax=unclassified Brevibacterium TaxID=2614124 RepID=UPI000C467234|nr:MULTISPECIES: molybdopterin molybdotransferase MoeA [unclassified Brevibacterium]SMY03347.1 molybdopterin molybdochelatase [Brevibacterium sp. 239c]